MSRSATKISKDHLLSPTRIRSYRERRGLTQLVVADRAILPAPALSAIEKGRKIASIAQIERIGVALELSADENEELKQLAVHDQIVNMVFEKYSESAIKVVSLAVQAMNTLDERESANLITTIKRVIDAKNLLLNPRLSM